MSNLTIRPINTGFIPTSRKLYHFHHSTHKHLGLEQDEKVSLPCLVFLIEGGEKLILVDTGMAWTERANEYHHPGSVQPEGYAIHEQLEKLGIKCEDIDIVIFTHMHWDHMFYLDKFVNARFIAHRKELEFAKDPIPVYYKSYEHPALSITAPFTGIEIETVDGEEEIIPGVRVFPSHGHSPGHQSVEVDTEEGTYIICGDAIFIYENLDPIPEIHYSITPPARYADIVACWKSIEEMKRRAKGREFILPSHEPSILERMEKTPVFGKKQNQKT